MNKFFSTCRRCLNPWTIGLIIVAITALIIYVPIVGVGTLIIAFPLLVCAVMCGGMVFMMGKKK